MMDDTLDDFMPKLRRKLKKYTLNRRLKHVSFADKDKSYKAKMNYPDNESFIGSYSIEEHYENKVMLQRFAEQQNTFQEKISFICSRTNWKKYVESNYMNKNFNICQISSNNGTVHCLKTYSLVKYKINQNHIEIDIIGSDGFIQFMKKSIADQFEIVNANIDWIYSTNGDSVSIPLTSDRMPVDEMYPFINRPIQEYYDDYMNSSASILLLFGPPGTGKTTFIRGLLQHSSKSAMVTYDSAILEKDFIFSSFIEGDSSIFIIEDADLFLKSRQEGNTMMHKFLNVGDGLVSTKEKKMIFSTNLPSVRDIDPALVRAGRCYDIVEFRNLTIDEGTKLSKKMNIDSDFGNKKEISLAEIFHPENGKKLSTSTKKSKVGFI
jgi:hypothetical protein